MERLTEKRYGSDHYYLVCSGTCESETCEECPALEKAVDRLGAYEDIGLEPEEIEAMKTAMMGKSIAEIREFDGVAIDSLRQLAQSEKEGRLVVLPCKLGDTMWTNRSVVGDYLRTKDRSYPCEVVFVGVSDNPFIHVVLPKGRMLAFGFWDIGKTVFLTREEAEAALEGIKNGHRFDRC